MATKAAVAVGLIPDTLNGTVDLTVSGFGTPSAAIIFASNANSTNNPQENNSISVGFWTSSASTGSGLGARQFSTTNVAARSGGTESDCVLIINPRTFAAGDDEVSVSCSAAAITDGIRLTVTEDNTGAQRYVTAILIAGTTNAKVVNYQLSTGTTYDITSIGFQPDLVFLSTTGDAAGSSLSTHAICSFGVAHNDGTTISQGMSAIYAEDEVATSDTGSYASDTYCVGQYFNGSLSWGGSAGSFDANGFTLTTNTNPGSDYINILALKLADPGDAWVDIIDTATSTGNQATTGVGFTPDVVGFASTIATALGTSTGGMSLALGAADGTTQRSLDAVAGNGQSSMFAESEADLSNVIRLRFPANGTDDTIASLSSLDSDGFTLNYSDGSATARKILAFAIGDSTATGGATTIDADFIASVTSVYEPTITTGAVTISADFISAATSVYEPTVTAPSGVQDITADFVAAATSVYEPTVFSGSTIVPDFIAATTAVYEPTITTGSVTIAADLIAAGTIVYEPTVSSAVNISADFIASATSVYEPTVGIGAVTIRPDFISSGTIVYEPSIPFGQIISADFIAATSAVYEPNVFDAATIWTEIPSVSTTWITLGDTFTVWTEI